MTAWRGLKFILSFLSKAYAHLPISILHSEWKGRKVERWKRKSEWPSLIEHSNETAPRLPPTLYTAFLSRVQSLHTYSPPPHLHTLRAKNVSQWNIRSYWQRWFLLQLRLLLCNSSFVLTSELEPKAHFHVHINYKTSQGILQSAAQCDLISYNHIRAAITECLAYKHAHYPPPIRCLVPNWICICCFGDLGASHHLIVHGMEMGRHQVSIVIMLSTGGLQAEPLN